MRNFSKFMISLMLLFPACSYSRFTITGVPHESLPEDTEIRIIPEGDLSRFDQIGEAEIKNSDKEYRIKEAKRLARLYGGEVIMPIEDENLEDSKIQSFRVLSPIQEETIEPIQEEPEKETIMEQPLIRESPAPEPETKPVEKEKPDYSNLPAVPYKILVGEFSNLKGERFRTSMYPIKIMGFPKELSPFAGGNKQLVELGTKKGENIVYLVTDRENAKGFEQRIKEKDSVRFVYTPVGLYNLRYPVLEFIDFID